MLRRALQPLVTVIRWLARRVHGLYTAFGLFLVMALALALAGLWLFTRLARVVVKGDTHRLDEAILQWMHGHASPGLDRLALQLTAVGDGGVVVVAALTVCGFLWVSRRRLAVLLMVVALWGADLIHRVLKLTFDRPRPELFVIDTPYARPTSASFPSGHAMVSMAFFFLVAYLLARLGDRGPFRIVVVLLVTVLILGIGFSRMYLGVHYPSDVLAGYLLGFVWVTFCIFGFEAVQVIRKRSRFPVVDPPAPTVTT